MGSTTDISPGVSHGQRMVEALSASLRRLETVFASAPIMMFCLDRQGKFTMADGQRRTPFGLAPRLLLGQSVGEVCRKNPDLLNYCQRALAGEMFTTQVSAGGRAFDTSFSSFRNADGLPDGMIAVATDITERVRALAALQQAEANYRSIFENAVEGIFQSTPEGRYLAVNPALARMYGYENPEELLNVSNIASDIYADPAAREEFRRRVEGQGKVEGLEYEVRRRDGSLIWICENTRVVHDSAGRSLYYEGTIQDITARKRAEMEKTRLESQLLHAQKMEAIGKLAGGIAHDFNNILSAVMGYTELSLQDLPPNSQIRANLQQVLAAGRRAGDLVRQILAFSRRDNAERHPLSLGRIAREVLKLVNAALPAGISCTFQSEIGEDWVLADGTQLHQVLMNLCTNAGYAMRGCGGRLEMRLDLGPPPASLNLSSQPFVHLSVSDTGVGMSPEIAKRIFEPYFTTKPREEGTGLGLAVVHGIVTGHGGGLTVESEEGRGTTFDLWFPQVSPRDSREPADKPMIAGTGRLLFVDDEETLEALAQKHLRRIGYRLTTRLDSREALATFRAQPDWFDAVVTDFEMPEINGVQLCQEVRKIRPGIPVFLCTGQMSALEAESTLAAGFTATFPKPLDFRNMACTLATVLKPRAD